VDGAEGEDGEWDVPRFPVGRMKIKIHCGDPGRLFGILIKERP